MKDKRFLVLVGILVLIVVFVGIFIYQRVIFSYSLTDLMNKLDGYWVNVDGKSDCEVVIFDDEKFIRGPVNTEPNEYAYVIESEKIEYNNYDLTINIIDVNGNEEDGKIHIDVSDLNDGKISLKIENIDNEYSQYEFISDNEDDVFNYCQSN